MIESPLPLCIITVVRNGASTLSETLASVRSLPVRPLTHVLVDGESTDDTPRLIADHRNLSASMGIETHALRSPPRGIYEAMNRGVLLAPPESIILFLNADDCVLPEGPWSSAVTTFAESQMQFVFAGLRTVMPDGRTRHRPGNPVDWPRPICQQQLLVRRSLLTTYPLPTDEGLAADAIWASTHLPGHSGLYVEEALVSVKLTGVSYREPWRSLRPFLRYLVRTGRYARASRELLRFGIGLTLRTARSVLRHSTALHARTRKSGADGECIGKS